MPDSVVLSLRGLSKQFGGVVAVDGIDLDIHRGEFVTLLGPSGCGKTTTVRMIGGYEEPTGGQILLDGVDITNVPARKRDIGMVFQDYALFPHMTVADNIGYPLRMRKWSRDRIGARVTEMLDLVRLEGMGKRRSWELSGGQKQRVALARALAFSPRLLLMDESLGALDAKLREYMQVEIRRIQQMLGITTIHVTHDQDEALGMSDRVVVMKEARIGQVATPRELYADPSSVYVADFVGRINLLRACVLEHTVEATILELEEPGLDPGSSRRVRARPAPDLAVGSSVRVGIRPEAMRIAAEGSPENSLHGAVTSTRFGGPLEYISVAIAPERTVSVIARPDETGRRSDVHVRWSPDQALILAAD